jgi:hypothetical protein
MKRFGAFALMLVISLFTATAFAQNATTSLRGVVKDATGAVLPNANVTLTDAANGQVLNAKTNKDGEYQLLQIPPAKYTITVNAKGFSEETETAELLVNKPATENFTMSVHGTNEVVDVTASAQTINTTDASLGGSKDNAEIQALPSETRNVADLLSLQPGVLYLPTMDQTSDSRSGSVNGGRSDQGNITLDGVDDNDQVNGFAFTGVLRETQDAVEEFNVTTGSGNADEGRSSGAQVSMLTKSGTNTFHGAAYEYFRPTNTVSNDFFNKQSQVSLGAANRPPKLIRNIFGVDVAGPIMKDKLFFFVNYEGLRKAESVIVTQTTAFPSYIAGNIQYQGDTASGALDPTTQTLTAGALATLDSYNGCAVCNTPSYPYNPGADPNALAYFKSMPAATLTTAGDGYNTGAYIFPSPNPVTQNTTIVKLDYNLSTKHRIFARGNLQKDTTQGLINFPGQPPSNYIEDNTKGMTFGDTWTISPKMVNDVRYGYIRQGYGNYGIGVGDYVDFRFVSSPTAETRTTIASVPVNNIVDNFNITEGKHSIQIGANWRLVHQNRISDANSYNEGSTNPYWLGDYGAPDPTYTSSTAEPVDGGFGNAYLIAYANLVGVVPSVTTQNNYYLNSATSGSLLADGAPLARHFKANEYEGYIQDSYTPFHGLTITAGVRYVVLQTPWETKGQEVTPTIDTDAWFKQREASALVGQIYEPNLTFAPAGPYYGKPGLWSKQKNNFAPRFAVAYSPNNKTSIRAGAGMYYDHFGEGLINIFDQSGSFGLSNSVTNPASTEYLNSSPRYTTRNHLPFNNGAVPSQITFPYAPLTTAATDFSISYGVNNKIQTPYNESFDFSVQRQLPGGFTLETDYVGRFGRHLIQAVDLAAPVDYVDPQGGGDYYAAGAQLSKITDANGNNAANVPSIPYFENVFSYMKNYDYNGESATQAVYNNEWLPNRTGLGETESIADLDFFCYYGCPAGHTSRFWQSQFASLYALSTIGMSYYNALQVSLHHPTSHGLQFDFNYTFSKSIDWGSDAERFGANGGASAILNSWKPSLNKGVSDFDTTHNITVNFVDKLPFGKGQAVFGGAGPIANIFIGGWQLSGILRMTSGLPFSLFEPGYTTNWDDDSYGVITGKLKAHKKFDSNFEPQYLGDPDTINSGVYNGTPVRLPYPGEAGERNNLRGDGYFGLDTGLNKSWHVHNEQTLKFAWEVYNATNTVRFDPLSINPSLTSGSTLGIASSLLTSPRRMQFSLRYDF